MIIPFSSEKREKYYKLLDQVFDSSLWSEGGMIRNFEKRFLEFTNLHSAAVSSGGAALSAIYNYIDVKGKDVIVPTNTFWATTIAAKHAGANVIYADCNKKDLCLSFEDMQKRITPNTKAIVVVHIGGHIAFDIEEIAEFCRKEKIFLIEDCAHAHGASWNGKTPGSWGFAGAYSFYATKTMPVGDGGMVVSKDKDFIDWIVKYRNYGKEVLDGVVKYHIPTGFNYRMSEMIAALGLVQLDELPRILQWKSDLAKKYDQIFENRVYLPEGMKSGYYKYIVFDYELNEQTGKVFANTDFGHVIDNLKVDLPNSMWIARHHNCAPIWYGWEHNNKNIDQLKSILLGRINE